MANKQYVVTLVKGKFQVHPIGSMDGPEKEFSATVSGWQSLEYWLNTQHTLTYRASSEVHEWLVENEL